MTKGIIIHPEELTDSMVELLGETSIDVLGLHPVGGPTADQSLDRLLALMKEESFQKQLEKVRNLGIKVEHELHALSWLVPRSLFEEKPSWFRVDEEGKRNCDRNICASNKEALAYLSDRAAELASILKSDTGFYQFWIDDAKTGSCHCDACKKISSSDQALILYHAILEGIRRVDPEASLAYLAYYENMTPPQVVKPKPGIFLEFAPIERDWDDFLDHAENEKNAQNLQYIKPLLDLFSTRDAKVLEYWMDNSLFSKWKKPPVVLPFHPEVAPKRHPDLSGSGI